jgi:hypothetical protein
MKKLKRSMDEETPINCYRNPNISNNLSQMNISHITEDPNIKLPPDSPGEKVDG